MAPEVEDLLKRLRAWAQFEADTANAKPESNWHEGKAQAARDVISLLLMWEMETRN
jgi:hypothetical protein